MKHTIVRIALVVMETFIALTAIVTGVYVLIAGPGVIQMSLDLLRNKPFSDYTIPMLILVVVVGGSSLLAAATVFIRREWSVLLSVVAGLMMIGFEVVELVVMQRYMWLQVLYFVLGVVIFALATYLWMTEYRSHHAQDKHVSHA